jgi:hypothetical protein
MTQGGGNEVTERNIKKWWTSRREQTARLVAEDRLTDDAIAARAKISRKTLEAWKLRADFSARVAEHRDAYRKAALAAGIADHVARVRALQDQIDRIDLIIRERADAHGGGESAAQLAERLGRVQLIYTEIVAARTDPQRLLAALNALSTEMAAPIEPAQVPGGKSGLLVRQLKAVGKHTVEEYSFDAALARERRALLQHMAQELGEWVEKRQMVNDITPEEAAVMTTEQLEARARGVPPDVVRAMRPAGEGNGVAATVH